MLEVVAVSWIPNDGPLVITSPFEYHKTIGSLYLPSVDVQISFSATPTPENGNPFYIAKPVVNNPQTIPMPEGTTSVTLTATSSVKHYVWASSGVFRPLLEGPIS